MAVDARVSEYLLELLRCALHDEIPSDKPAEASWQAVFQLAKRHSVSALAWQSVSRLPELIDPAVNEAWSTLNSKLIGKYFNQEHELDVLSSLLAEEKIPHMPVKSVWLRPLYPQPFEREMCDLDILIPEEDAERAHDIAIDSGYTMMEELTTSHNTEYVKKPYLALELHTFLAPKESSHFSYYEDIWQRAVPTDTPYYYSLTLEDQYIYLLAHTKKHYNLSGTGIRSYLDIYVFLSHHQDQLDRAYIEAELKKLQIYEFAVAAEALAFSWFSKERLPLSEAAEEMAYYVFSGATYGQANGKDKNALRSLMADGKSAKQARFSFFMRIVFLPYDKMMVQFPSLKKVPFLLPFYWIWRWILVLITKPRQVIRQYRRVKKIDVFDPDGKK